MTANHNVLSTKPETMEYIILQSWSPKLNSVFSYLLYAYAIAFVIAYKHFVLLDWKQYGYL